MAGLYESQRAMRAMRKASLQRGVIAVLDMGTAKIGCFILRFEGSGASEGFDVVGSLAGQSEFRVVGAATTQSRGVEFGEIISMPQAERAIRTVLQSAQKMARLHVDHVIACFSGVAPLSYGVTGEVNVESQIVQDQDVARVLAACDIPDFGEPVSYTHLTLPTKA